MRLLVRPLLLALGLAALAGCQRAPAPIQACTMIGCSDGLTVLVENAPAAPYTVEATLPDGSTRSARCEAPVGCPEGLFIEGLAAARVTIRVVGAGGSSTHEVTPAYTVSRPNGPSCPPECRQARVQVAHRP